jgi:hypothetical protein
MTDVHPNFSSKKHPRAAFWLGAICLLVGGCNPIGDRVARLAESTRSATEQMASKSEERNRQREIEIDVSAGQLRRPPSPLFVERFETREGPDGYFIYDTQTQSIARIGGQRQSGLTYEQAEDAFGALADADAKGGLP